MSLLFMEGFDGYGGTTAHAAKWADVGTLSATGRTGAYKAGQTWGRAITSGSQTLILGFAFFWNGASSGGGCTIWDDASFGVNFQCSVTIDSDGKISVRTGSTSGTIIESSAAGLVVGSAWNFIEAKLTVGNSSAYEVKLNGVSVVDGTGDLQSQAGSTIAAVSFNNATSCFYDDIYVLDDTGSYLNDFIGDCKVECLSPATGNGTNTGLTCSTGSDHGALVDELPANDDTDYNFGSTAGVKDTYNFGNLTTSGTVFAVQASARVKKSDASAKTFALVARENSTDSDGDTQAAATSYSQFQQIWETRPSDDAAWTVSDVDGGEFGLKVVA